MQSRRVDARRVRAYGVGVGVGIALVYSPAIACVQPWFTRRRGLAAGVASAGIGAGTVAVPLLAAAAIAALQWRGALRAVALGVLVVGVGATLLLRSAPLAKGSTSRDLPGATLAQTLRSRHFWWLYAAVAAASPSMFIPFAHASAAGARPGHRRGKRGGPGRTHRDRQPGRALRDRRAGRSPGPDRHAGARAGIGWRLPTCCGTRPAAIRPWPCLRCGSGLSYGGIVSLLPAICMDLFGARAVASIIGTLYTAAALGNLLGPVVAGAVFDRVGSYGPVIWGCMAMSALATLASWRLVGARTAAY